VQLILQFVGMSGNVDLDTDLHTDVGSGDVGHASADLSFKILSLQGLTAFFMMFGLVGIALRTENSFDALPALVGAVAAGWGSTWVIGRIFKAFGRMQSSGTLDMRKAVGATGTVYLGIRKDKPGKVQVTVAGRLLTIDAITEGDAVLETGKPIRVVKVVQDNLVVVEAS